MFQIQHKATITCDKMLKDGDTGIPRTQCENSMIITGLPAEDSIEAFKNAGWHTNPDGDINHCPVHAHKSKTDEAE